MWTNASDSLRICVQCDATNITRVAQFNFEYRNFREKTKCLKIYPVYWQNISTPEDQKIYVRSGSNTSMVEQSVPI